MLQVLATGSSDSWLMRGKQLWLNVYRDADSGVPRNFFFGGWGSTNSVEDRGQRGRGSGDGSPLVRGSGGSCSLVQGISFHIVKFSQFLVL